MVRATRMAWANCFMAHYCHTKSTLDLPNILRTKVMLLWNFYIKNLSTMGIA